MNKRLITISMILVACAGCGQKSVPQATEEAYGRWYRTRAMILHGVARELFESGQLDKARSKILESLALDETYSQGRILLGKIYIEKGEFSLAVSELSRAHRELPKSSEVLFVLGVAQEKDGQLDDALISYRRCQALDGSNIEAVMAATEVLATQGRTRQARLYVESYFSIADGEAGIYELAGRLAMMEKDYEASASYYEQAHDLDFKNVRYVESLAKAQFFSGFYRHAVLNLEQLTDTEDYQAGAWVYTMLGDCYMATNRPRKARDSYYRVTELSPSDPGAWANLAKSALRIKDVSRAILAARQALALDARFLEGSLVLGYALLRDGQVNRSVNLLSEATVDHPASAELQCVLGRAYAARGDGADAMRCYAMALEIEPDNLLARELLSGPKAR